MISTAAPREFVAGLTTKLSTESLPRYSVRYSDTVEFEELLVGLELDGPLLTEDQRELFKPLVIHVGGIAGLPLGFFSSWDQMNQTCKPLTLQWQLADLKSYHSRCYRQNDSIDMDEVQVILMGLLPVEKIRELLQSRPLIIDLYDRVPDSKSTAESPKDAFSVGGTYGTQPGDDKFGYVEANMENIHESDEPSTAENKFTVDQYPTGRVVVHLREMLVLEQNVMDCTYSVTPLSETTLDLQTAMRTTSENPRKVKRQYVGYLDAGCSMSVRIELSGNLNQLKTQEESPSLGLKRFVFVVRMCDTDPGIQRFHLNDREFDFIILEAPDSQLARKLEGLIEEHMKHGKDVFGQYIRILYNSELSFTEHLYWHLDWALSPIQLMVPMNELIRQPLFHVRDLVPRLAYCAIERLQTIRNTCQTLVDVAQADLFPTMAMLEAIRGEFAIPTALVSNACSRGSTASRRVPIKQSTDSAPTDRVEVTLPAAHKETTLKRPWTNYIGRQPIFSRNRTCFSSITRLFRSTTEMSNATFSYSIQKLNATELAKSELQTTLLSPRKRYTYSQFYLRSGEFAAAVDPLDWPSTLRRVGSDTRNRNLRSQERKPKWDAYPPKVGHAQERVHFKARIQKKLNQGLLPTPDLRI
ncbi:unnamed protein product [Echinostoma caproni]|uniref:AAA domain-containing protein n=1 Tax=Echinostoma caproni TaxID=27848 RepID=A0A183A7X6_9TREM|nr:unnamed protein product [Echinostoma caproni]